MNWARMDCNEYNPQLLYLKFYLKIVFSLNYD